MKITVSKKFSLAWMDAAKGALIAALTGGMTALQQAIDPDNYAGINWKVIGMAALGGLVAYLLKNFFSGPAVIAKPETEAEKKDLEKSEG